MWLQNYIPSTLGMAVPFFLGSFFTIDMCVGSIVPPAPGIPRGDQGEGRSRRHDGGGSGSRTRGCVGREETAAVAVVAAMAGRGGARGVGVEAWRQEGESSGSH
jgi:hypothetical protein